MVEIPNLLPTNPLGSPQANPPGNQQGNPQANPPDNAQVNPQGGNAQVNPQAGDRVDPAGFPQPASSNTGATPPDNTNPASTSLNGGQEHTIDGDLNVAQTINNNITHNYYAVDNGDRQREVKDAYREVKQVRQRSAPPPADAPSQDHVKHWFQDNDWGNDQERFFVITLGLFNKLKYADFKDIYEIVLDVMQIKSEDEKKKARSYFGTSDIDLVEKAHAEIVREMDGLEDILRFKKDEYESAVFEYLRKHHRNVLLDLLPALKKIGEYRYWETRSRAAEAVAEIGKMGFHRMRTQVLEPWARGKHDYVRAAVGYAVGRLYKDAVMQPAVDDLLKDWSDADQSWTWQVRWTVASVYKHFDAEHLDVAFAGLKRIAQYNDRRIADSVIHTLAVLSLQDHLEAVICALGEWVAEGTGGKGHDDEREIVCIVAIYAFVFLAVIHLKASDEEKTADMQSDQFKAKAGNFFELVKKSAAERGKVWQSIVNLGVRALENKRADLFFFMIALWAEPASKDGRLRDTFCDLLAEIFECSQPNYRERVFNELSKWERQTKSEALSSVARSAKSEIKRRVL